MADNVAMAKTEYETVFDYTHGTNRFEASQRIDKDEVHVNCSHYCEGEYRYGTSSSVPNEEMAKVFFYDKLKSQLGGSWLIMDTLIDKEVEIFHKRMKQIEQEIPAAIVKKYAEILGPLEDINQDVLEKAAVELKLICEGWYKK